MYNQVFGYIKCCLLGLVRDYFLYFITVVITFLFPCTEMSFITFYKGPSAVFQFCCKFLKMKKKI